MQFVKSSLKVSFGDYRYKRYICIAKKFREIVYKGLHFEIKKGI